MGTLQITCHNGPTYELWAWDLGPVRRTARCLHRLGPRKGLFIAQLGSRGGEPTALVVAKIAFSNRALEGLTREYDSYKNEVAPLQGSVVPRCYGLFKGKMEGQDIGCLLLENCAGYQVKTQREWVEQSRKMMLATCRLHNAGILHGGLADLHHFVRCNDGVRIVDFSLAVRYQCQGGMPRLYPVPRGYGAWRENYDESQSCQELVLMKATCGFGNERQPDRVQYVHY